MRMVSALCLVPLVTAVAGAQSPSDQHVPGSGGLGITIKVLPPDPYINQPLRYVLSEPGYVAAFVIYPGAGVRLLYPEVNAPEQIQYAGYHAEQLITARFDNDIYHAVLGPVSPIGPAYLYVVASRHPLDVARYAHHPMQLASAVGQTESRSFYNDVQFDALLNNAVSLGDDYSWDSDVYMLWPNSTSSGRYANGSAPPSYTYVTCTDGSNRLVPANYPFQGCPGQSHIRAVVLARAQQLASATTVTGVRDVATVLPTIIGKPETAAEHRAALRTGTGQRVPTVEVANGDEAIVAGSQASAVQLEAIAVTPRTADSPRASRDELHGSYSAERRARIADEQRMRTQNAEIANAPQLAPNPALAPNPSLAPNPGFSNRSGGRAYDQDAVRFDRQDTEMRSSRGDADQGQARQQFNEQRQEQVRQRQEQRTEQRAEPRQQEAPPSSPAPAPRSEPVRSAPPPTTPVPMAAARMDSPAHAGRAADQ